MNFLLQTNVLDIIPTMKPVDMGSNPFVQMLMVGFDYVIGIIGFAVILVGITNLILSLVHVFSGKHEKIRVGGIVGPEIGNGGSKMLIVVGEFFIGMMLVGFFLTGSWTGPINGMVNFGKTISEKLSTSISSPQAP